MELNLEQAFEEPIDLSHLFEVSAERLGRPDVLSLQPVAFSGRLARADKGFLLDAEIRIAGSVACARCLREVPFERRAATSWVFAPEHERPNEADLELAADDLDVVWYGELTVPLDPLIDEQLQLELPMKPLCSDACRGLCPHCGVDRNTVQCSCVEPEDDRWTPLKALIR